MIRCLVFDFDGVLVDTNQVKRDAFFAVFSEFGEVGKRWVREILAQDTDSDRFQIIGAVVDCAIAQKLIGQSVSRDNLVGEYAASYNAICEDYAGSCAEIEGAAETISSLSSRYPLYIISATPVDPLRRIVAARGWQKWFKGVFGRPGAKPEHLKRVLETESVFPRELLFIGDGKRDLDAAVAVGSRFVGIRNEFNDFETTGVRMLSDLRDIEATIEELDAQPVGGRQEP